MKNVVEIDGRDAVVSFDPEIRMFRDEFLDLNGGADFLAEDREGLVREGRVPLRVFLEICAEKGVSPWPVHNLRPR